MAVLTIALALCALAYGLFCFILPFIVYFSLKDLRQRTARLEDTLQKSTPLRVRTADALPGTPDDATRAR
jgi:hypothetical protein